MIDRSTLPGMLLLMVLFGAGCGRVTPMSPTSSPEVAPTTAIGTQPVPSEATSTMPVTIFLLAAATEEEVAQNRLRGCDLVREKIAQVPRSTNKLQAAISAIFQEPNLFMDGSAQKAPGDFGLALQSAEGKSGVAIVALTGSYHSAGICDDPRLPVVIQDTACRFPEVRKVRILVNGERYNFTDQSGLYIPVTDYVCPKS